jgi:hypothetical protein
MQFRLLESQCFTIDKNLIIQFKEDTVPWLPLYYCPLWEDQYRENDSPPCEVEGYENSEQQEAKANQHGSIATADASSAIIIRGLIFRLVLALVVVIKLEAWCLAPELSQHNNRREKSKQIREGRLYYTDYYTD